MANTLGSLSIGDKIKFGSIYGNPITWKISDKNHTGYPANSVSLITERIIKICAFDGAEATNSDADRKNYGNNRYLYSNLLQWLNKDVASWYEAQHSADAPPTKANCQTYNGYDSSPGFLFPWTDNEKAALLDTTVVVNLANVDGGGTENVMTKIFLPSNAEAGLSGGAAEGYIHPIFSDNNSRVAMPTSDAVTNSDYKDGSLNVSAGWNWWCRGPNVWESGSLYNISIDGSMDYGYAYSGRYTGVRTLCNLKSDYLVSDSTDSDGCYTLIFNEPPTVPGSITVPSSIAGGAQLTVSWGQSTDPEGTTVSYNLERTVDSGSWTQVYSGTNLTYTDTAPIGASTLQYRVKAIDEDVKESEYKTSSEITVYEKQLPAPASITVPSKVSYGSAVAVQWGSSTDPDGGSVTYELESMIDGGSWTQVYAGGNLSFNDTAPAQSSEAETLQYRVRAKDSIGIYSGYKTSSVIDVGYNEPPTITGADEDLGQFTDTFPGYAYTVDDEDSPSVTVQEKIDGVEFRSYTPDLGQEQTFALDGVDWFKITNGSHTVELIATDSDGASTVRTLTFDKDVDTIEFYTKKIPATAMPKSILVNIQGSIPVGSILTVKTANNADDTTPVWEDITGSLGSKATFTNNQKTSGSWAVQLHITLERDSAVLPCYISSVDGEFA